MDTALMRWLLVGQDILLFILPAVIIAWIAAKRLYGATSWGRAFQWLRMGTVGTSNRASVFLMATILMLVAQPGINLIASLNEMIKLPEFLSGMEAWMQRMEAANAATTEQLMATKTIGGFLANIMVIGLLAAFSEELLFRGALQGLFMLPAQLKARRRGDVLTDTTSRATTAAIWAAAILFSALHMQFYGFIPRMLMGALFGYMLVWSGSLWIPILMHAVNNSMVVIAYAVLPKDKIISSTLETFGTADTWYVGVISLALVAGLIYRIRKILLSSQV